MAEIEPFLIHVTSICEITKVSKHIWFCITLTPLNIQFKLVPKKVSLPCVDVLEAAYPPPEEVMKQRYHYRPCPNTHKPPIPVNVLVHAFFDPSAHTFQYWLSRLLKKLKDQFICNFDTQLDEVTENSGWGIHIIEGPNWLLDHMSDTYDGNHGRGLCTVV